MIPAPVHSSAGAQNTWEWETFCDFRLKSPYVSEPVWYGILEFNVPLDTVWVISETGALSSDEHLPFSNGGPATTVRDRPIVAMERQ